MMQHEFENMTGMKVSGKTYAAIEALYYAFDGDKKAFCKDFMEHKDERLMQLIDEQIDNLDLLVKNHRDEVKELRGMIKGMEAEVERLDNLLEKEQEWKPYVDEHNVKQSDYDSLVKSTSSGMAHIMTDAEAIDWITSTAGFDPQKIRIIREVEEQQVNRHNRIRKTGKKIDRSPIYCATDWHYILFMVNGRAWELYNDELRAYWR